MKVDYRKYSIEIIPENDQDEVYLESVTKLKTKGQRCIAERVAAMGMDNVWAYLRIKAASVDLP